MDLISVIIPVWQVETYLPECIESVLRQTYGNIEVILVDDGSLDQSGNICDDYAKRDSRIQVIHQKNQGSSVARNTGFIASKGKYVCFVDSDDMLSCFFLEKLYQLIQENGVEIAVCHYTDYKGDLGKVSGRNTDMEVVSGECMLKQWHGKRKEIETVVWNKLYDRQIFRKLEPNLFPVGKLHEDIYASHQFINEAQNIAITTEKLYFYRNRNDSISKSISKENRIQDLCAQKERMSFFKEKHYFIAYFRLLSGHLLHKIKYAIGTIRDGIFWLFCVPFRT